MNVSNPIWAEYELSISTTITPGLPIVNAPYYTRPATLSFWGHLHSPQTAPHMRETSRHRENANAHLTKSASHTQGLQGMQVPRPNYRF